MAPCFLRAAECHNGLMAGSLNLDLYLPCLQVPNIFIGGRGVGGCNEGPGLLPLYRAGQLAPMLRDVGAL